MHTFTDKCVKHQTKQTQILKISSFSLGTKNFTLLIASRLINNLILAVVVDLISRILILILTYFINI